MSAQFADSFRASTNAAFETMLGWEIEEVQRGSRDAVAFAYSGVIGVTGPVCGSVVLRLSAEVAAQAAATLHGVEAAELDEEDIIDTVGELANMVVGCAKAKVTDHDLAITVPGVINGKGHTVNFSTGVSECTVDFDSEWGPFAVCIGLKSVLQPASL